MEREKNQVGSRLVVSTIRDYINNIHSKLDMLIDTINTLMELDHKELEKMDNTPQNIIGLVT